MHSRGYRAFKCTQNCFAFLMMTFFNLPRSIPVLFIAVLKVVTPQLHPSSVALSLRVAVQNRGTDLLQLSITRQHFRFHWRHFLVQVAIGRSLRWQSDESRWWFCRKKSNWNRHYISWTCYRLTIFIQILSGSSTVIPCISVNHMESAFFRDFAKNVLFGDFEKSLNVQHA